MAPQEARLSSAGSSTSVPLTFSAIGKAGVRSSMSSSMRRIGATAGSISGEWNAPATLSRIGTDLSVPSRAPPPVRSHRRCR